MGCGCTKPSLLMHIFGNQSTRSQRRNKMIHNRNQNALRVLKELSVLLCDANAPTCKGKTMEGR